MRWLTKKLRQRLSDLEYEIERGATERHRLASRLDSAESYLREWRHDRREDSRELELQKVSIIHMREQINRLMELVESNGLYYDTDPVGWTTNVDDDNE